MNLRRTAVILFLLLALMIAGALLFRSVKDPQAAAEVPQESGPAHMRGIVRLAYSRGDERFVLLCTDGVWTLEDDAQAPLDQGKCASLAEKLRTLSPVETLEDAEEAQLGLAEPACSLLAENAQGETREYRLGAYNAYAGLYSFTDGERIFLIEPLDAQALLVSAAGLLDLDKPALIDAQDVISLFVRTHSGQWNYTLSRTDEGFIVSGSLVDAARPAEAHAADGAQALAVFKSLSMLYLYECVSYKPTQEALEAYGLEKPTARAELLCRGQDGGSEAPIVWLFGARENGRIYVRIEGSDAVYTADENEAACFLAPDFTRLIKE